MTEWFPIKTALKAAPILIKKGNQIGIAIYDDNVFGNWRLCTSVQFFKNETQCHVSGEVLPLPTWWTRLPNIRK